MSRVLVTGAGGFIGRRVLEPLQERGFEVHAVSRRRNTDSGDRAVTWHSADLLDRPQREAVVEHAGASHLLHLAWYAEHGRFWTHPENVRWVGATGELLQEFAQAGGKRAVLAGSCAEYDWTGDGICVEGETPLRPAKLYGTCKDATRRICEALGRQLDVSVAWGRVFFIYGPEEDERRLVAAVARALVAGERAATSEGTHIRDFLHVDDVAEAFAALVSAEVEGAVNIGAGRGVAIREVVEEIGRAAGRPDLLDIGALPAREGDPPVLVPDVGRLNATGWQPRLALRSGLSQTVDWWRSVSE